MNVLRFPSERTSPPTPYTSGQSAGVITRNAGGASTIAKTGPAEAAGRGGIRPDLAELGGASISYDIDGLLRLYEEVVRDTLVVPK